MSRTALLFAIALGIRAGWTLLAPVLDPLLAGNPLLGDAAGYDRMARYLLDGRGYVESNGRPSAFWPPLYPLFLAAVYGVFGHSLLIPRLLQALLGALLPMAVYASARPFTGDRVAWIAALGLAFYPYLIYFGAWLIAEALFFALFGLLLGTAARLRDGGRDRDALLLGGFLGLCALAKPAVLFQIPFLALWLGLGLPSRQGRAAALAALALAACLAPWTVRNALVFERFVPVSTNAGYTFYGANNPDAFGGHAEDFPPRHWELSETAEQDAYLRAATAWIADHPGEFARLAVRKLRRLFLPLSVASSPHEFPLPGAALIHAVYFAFLALAAAGLLLSLARWRDYLLFYAPLAGVVTSAVVFYGDARYLLPAAPSLCLFAALAIITIHDRARARAVID
ncbi:MAG: glycosyltransferase family 39 protein [Bryobacteraceae bacterium]|nr:glycosyltransferase family 39 protein [Bryobacteraceae bacterium]